MRIGVPVLVVSAMLLVDVAGPQVVFAHGGAKGIVKERMDLMKSIGKAMKSVGQIARGKQPLDAEKVAEAASSIASHGERIPALFPTGSGHGVTEASPRIWADPEGFRRHAMQLVTAAQKLGTAARTNDLSEVKTAYRAVGKACGTCHKQFRVKKENH